MIKFKDLPGSAAEEYHIESRNTTSLKMPSLMQINYDEHIQELVRDAPLHIERENRIALPYDHEKITMTVEEAITSRVSGRTFSDQAVSLPKLAKILYLANGVRKSPAASARPTYDRNVPNSGGLGSVEVYPIIMTVSDVEPGIYHFDSVYHELRLLKKGHFATWLREFAFMQIEPSEAAVVFVLTSAVGRLTTKYGARAYRLALLDVGHVSDNIYLTATALSLNVCAYNGFIDTPLNQALELDGLERCTFLCLGVGCR